MRAVSLPTFLSTYLPALTLATGLGIALPAIPKLAASFGVGFGVASFVLTAYLIGQVVATLPAGWLVDRFGRRPVMIAGPVVAAASAFAIAGTTSFGVLLVLRFVGGVAATLWLTSRLSLISHTASPNERGRLISWLFGMDNVGRLVGPIAGGFIAQDFGPRATFVACGVFAIVALVPAILFNEPDRPATAAAHAPQRPSRRELVALIVPRIPYFGISLFAGISRGPIFSDLLHLYAAYAYRLTPAQIGYLATSAAVVSLPLAFLAGWLLDHYGRRETMLPSFGGVAVLMAALASSAYLHANVVWYVALFLVAVGVQSLTGGSVQTLAADYAPDAARGTFLGLWLFTSQGGAALGPVLFAVIADTVDYGAAFLFTATAASVVTGLALWLIPARAARVRAAR